MVRSLERGGGGVTPFRNQTKAALDGASLEWCKGNSLSESVVCGARLESNDATGRDASVVKAQAAPGGARPVCFGRGRRTMGGDGLATSQGRKARGMECSTYLETPVVGWGRFVVARWLGGRVEWSSGREVKCRGGKIERDGSGGCGGVGRSRECGKRSGNERW